MGMKISVGNTNKGGLFVMVAVEIIQEQSLRVQIRKRGSG